VESSIFARGEPDKPGEPVSRGVLQVVGGPKVSFDKKSSGRLQLAQWIASPENPLTARVYVNRIWLQPLRPRPSSPRRTTSAPPATALETTRPC